MSHTLRLLENVSTPLTKIQRKGSGVTSSQARSQAPPSHRGWSEQTRLWHIAKRVVFGEKRAEFKPRVIHCELFTLEPAERAMLWTSLKYFCVYYSGCCLKLPWGTSHCPGHPHPSLGTPGLQPACFSPAQAHALLAVNTANILLLLSLCVLICTRG